MVYRKRNIGPGGSTPSVSDIAGNWITLPDQHNEILKQFNKEVIGAENLFNRFFSGVPLNPTYPPYNVERMEDNKWKISIAAAGFDKDELDVVREDNILTISGSKSEKEEDDKYLYRGIAQRDFSLQYRLTEHVEVKDVVFTNGMLVVDLQEEIPEEKKPKSFEIKVK